MHHLGSPILPPPPAGCWQGEGGGRETQNREVHDNNWDIWKCTNIKFYIKNIKIYIKWKLTHQCGGGWTTFLFYIFSLSTEGDHWIRFWKLKKKLVVDLYFFWMQLIFCFCKLLTRSPWRKAYLVIKSTGFWSAPQRRPLLVGRLTRLWFLTGNAILCSVCGECGARDPENAVCIWTSGWKKISN